MNRRSLFRAAAATAVVAACGAAPTAASPTPTTSPSPSATPLLDAKSARVELAKGASFTFRLRGDKAPQTVSRFIEKSRTGFYNDKTFHRVEGWVVQGGDPTGTGSGGNQVPSEYNDLPFLAGAVGIARSSDASRMNDSQFFIVKTDARHLDRLYANFGAITSGMDVVNGIKIGDKIKTIKIE
jgi:cyclophilin family peptidyl-prolyl cis-trans isomerase